MKNSCISSIPVCLKTKVDTKTYRHKTQKLMKYFLMTDQQNIKCTDNYAVPFMGYSHLS